MIFLSKITGCLKLDFYMRMLMFFLHCAVQGIQETSAVVLQCSVDIWLCSATEDVVKDSYQHLFHQIVCSEEQGIQPDYQNLMF